MSDYQRILQQVKKEDLSSSQKDKTLKVLGELKKSYDSQMRGSGKKRMKGRGFLEWLSTAANDVNNFLKDNKILSKIAGPVLEYIIPAAATLLGSPVSGVAASAAGFAATEGLKSLGYGKLTGGAGNGLLTINLPGQRLTGKMPGKIPGKMTKIKGGGGVQFYSPSSEYGMCKF